MPSHERRRHTGRKRRSDRTAATRPTASDLLNGTSLVIPDGVSFADLNLQETDGRTTLEDDAVRRILAASGYTPPAAFDEHTDKALLFSIVADLYARHLEAGGEPCPGGEKFVTWGAMARRQAEDKRRMREMDERRIRLIDRDRPPLAVKT
jgi:hypothetical protein